MSNLKFDNYEKKEQLRTFAKLVKDAASKQPNPQLILEQDLLIEIAKITNDETARKSKDLFHPSKNVYDFNDYLIWLSNLENLLLCGTSPDEAFDIIRNSIDKKYQEPIAIFKDYL